MLLTAKDTERLFWRFTTPCVTTVEAPLGPVITQLTELIVSPPGSVSAMPSDPTPSRLVPPGDWGSVDCGPSSTGEVPPDEQPTCCTARVAPAPRNERRAAYRR